MLRFRRFQQISRWLVVFCASFLSLDNAVGGTIFESATLGPTGVPFSDVLTQITPGTNVGRGIFQGVRFYVSTSAETSRIGGHFVAPTTGLNLFGAIVRLTDEADFPDSSDLSTADVLGVTSIPIGMFSGESLGNLSVPLDPGWHALVFGGGLFGAGESAAVLRNGVDVGSPRYITWDTNFGGIGWGEQFNEFRNQRYVIEGQMVPESMLGPHFFLIAGTLLLRGAARGAGRSAFISDP